MWLMQNEMRVSEIDLKKNFLQKDDRLRRKKQSGFDPSIRPPQKVIAVVEMGIV